MANGKEILLGVDIGQQRDYTAISVIESHTQKRERVLEKRRQIVTESTVDYRLRYLERPELGTPYPEVVNRVTDMVLKLGENGDRVHLCVDVTGVGRPVQDYMIRTFRDRAVETEVRIKPAWITITGGDAPTYAGGGLRVPKRDLVSSSVVAMQDNRLKLPRALPLRHVLTEELRNFKVKINTRTAHDSYEAWRDGDHDDLVLAVAMPLWVAETFLKPRMRKRAVKGPEQIPTRFPSSGDVTRIAPPPAGYAPITRSPLAPKIR